MNSAAAIPVRGDITAQKADVIVNAANATLLGGYFNRSVWLSAGAGRAGSVGNNRIRFERWNTNG